MFTSSSTRRLQESFAARFETAGDKVFFRRNAAAPPIRVTPQERDDFIAGYARTMRYSSWGVVLGTIVAFGIVTILAFRSAGEFSNVEIYLAIGVVLAASFAVHWWAWTRPWRALQYRMAAGPARSPAELKQAFFERLTWSRLGGLVLIPAVIPLSAASRTDVLHGWGRLWLVVSAALWLLLAVQAFRKWRYDTAKKRSPGENP